MQGFVLDIYYRGTEAEIRRCAKPDGRVPLVWQLPGRELWGPHGKGGCGGVSGWRSEETSGVWGDSGWVGLMGGLPKVGQGTRPHPLGVEGAEEFGQLSCVIRYQGWGILGKQTSQDSCKNWAPEEGPKDEA